MTEVPEPLWQWKAGKTVLLRLPFTQRFSGCFMFMAWGVIQVLIAVGDWLTGRFSAGFTLAGLGLALLLFGYGLASALALRKQKRQTQGTRPGSEIAWPPGGER